MKQMTNGLLLLLVLVLAVGSVTAQQTTGGIQGVVKDSSGGIVPGVSITITDKGTGRQVEALSNDSGLYVVRSLQAGTYEVKAALEGFKTSVQTVVIEVGTMANGDIALEIGQLDQVVMVEGVGVRVDTATNTVAGTVDSELIRNLPLNGRNFLDVAQTQPGVQLVDGGSFDPTKNQFTGVSMSGRSGRVTRITIDGVDISDETVGTTTQNISVDAVQEFQVSQSTFDPSTSLSSSGAVNIVTKSGSNDFHGSAFLYYRDEEVAALPTTRTGDPATDANLESAEFDREQGGFEFGGPFIKDTLFFFVNYEKVNQDGSTFTSLPLFPTFNGAVTTPFNDNLGIGRLDWNVTDSINAFFRFSTETNDAATGFGGASLAPFVNQNVTNVTAVGFDVATSKLTHSVRYGFTSFDNEISTNNLGLPEFSGGGSPVSVAINSRAAFFSGPNRLAPQATYQTDNQFKYDGALITGNHTVRYGLELKLTEDNVFASFFGVGPEVRLTSSDSIRAAIAARGGDVNDPLEYPISFAILGNGQGSFTEIANNGRPGGGANNTRYAWYVADSWRVNPSLNLNFGLRWDLNNGHVNDDLGLPTSLTTILGSEGIRPTRLDKNNFGPQVGFAWQPFGDAKTVIRGGAGIFYETNIFNNVIFDRTDRLPVGLGFNTATPPLSNIDGQGRLLVNGVPVNNFDTRLWQDAPLSDFIDQIGQTQRDYQTASAAVPFDPNGTILIEANGTTFQSIIVQDYSTPYAIHTNFGFERELKPGWVMSVDFVRAKNLHHNIIRDFNRDFAANTLNVASAQARINTVLAGRGEASIDEAIANGATISTFGLANSFQGIDPNFDAINVIMSSGRSEYKALQVRSTARFGDVGSHLKNFFMNISYSLSRFTGMSTDQDFLPSATFADDLFNPRNRGPAGLDRTHQLSAQFFFEIPWGIKFNWNQRWSTARPQNLLVQAVGGSNAIFSSDFDGDGTTGDFLPGVSRGEFGRGISSVEELNSAITQYNNSVAGTVTPAGQALISAGLFTQAQLVALGAVAQPVALAPGDQVFNDSFITSDVRISKLIHVGGERVTIEPQFEIFNLFNVANYGILGNTIQGNLTGQAGAPNGTVQGNRTNLIGLGSGSFSQGIPRSIQFGLRVSF